MLLVQRHLEAASGELACERRAGHAGADDGRGRHQAASSPERSSRTSAASACGTVLGRLDGARADDDPVDELRRRPRVLGGRDAEAGVAAGTSVSARARSASGASVGASSARAPVVPVTVTR